MHLSIFLYDKRHFTIIYNNLLCYLKLLKVAKARLCIRPHCLFYSFRVISNRKTVDFSFQRYSYTFFVVSIKKTMVQNFVHSAWTIIASQLMISV